MKSSSSSDVVPQFIHHIFCFFGYDSVSRVLLRVIELLNVWKVSVWCLEGSGKCLEDVWKMSGKGPMDVWRVWKVFGHCQKSE